VACTRIGLGKGVCGSAWLQKSTIIVPDVDQFPGHIACSSQSRSEIVVPGIYEQAVQCVLDIDSSALNTFDTIDQHYLEQLMDLLLSEPALDFNFK
jgi:GAF domain-containing protein